MDRTALAAAFFLALAASASAQTRVEVAENDLELRLAELGDEEARLAWLDGRRAEGDGLAALLAARRRAAGADFDLMLADLEAGLERLSTDRPEGWSERSARALVESSSELLAAGRPAEEALRLLERAAGLELGAETASEVAFLRARFGDHGYEAVARAHPGTEGARRALHELALEATALPVPFESDGPGTIPVPLGGYPEARRRLAEAIRAGEGTIWADSARRAEKEYLHALTDPYESNLVVFAEPYPRMKLVHPEKDPVVYRLYREAESIEAACERLHGRSGYEAPSDGEALLVVGKGGADELELPGPGLYLLEVESATFLAVRRIAVSPGSVSIRAGEGRAVLAVTDRTGAPWPGARVRGSIECEGLVRHVEGATGPDGLFDLEPAFEEGIERFHYQLVVEAGRGFTPLAGSLERASPPARRLQAYVFADRPLYRPGHVAHLKGVVRIWNGAACLEPEAVPYHLGVHRNHVSSAPVFETDVSTGPRGSFHLDWEVPRTALPGSYVYRLLEGEREVASGALARVEEFRPPEVHLSIEPDREVYRPGDEVVLRIEAAYHFGGKASGLAGTVLLGERPVRFVTDASGRAEIRFAARLGKRPIHAWVLDSGNRRIEADPRQLRFREDGAARPLSVVPASPVFRASEGILLLAKGTGTIELLREGSDLAVARREVDASPEPVLVRIPVARGGTYLVHEEGYRHRRPLARVRVAPEGEGVLAIHADRRIYLPGDVARVHVSGMPGQRVLVEVETDRVERRLSVVLVEGVAAFDLTIDEASVPEVVVTATSPDPRTGRTMGAQERLAVEDPRDVLTVEVRPDRERYRPGEEASFDLAVRDDEGRPVSAEISLGVVDAAIYDLQEDLAPRLVRYFRGPSRNVAGEPSDACAIDDGLLCLSGLFEYDGNTAIGLGGGGAYGGRFGGRRNLVARGGGGGVAQREPAVRRDFRYTAYWHPAVATDAGGNARVHFAFPDNLTAWRVTARVFARGARAGMVVVQVATALPVFVRSRHPRVLVRGDELLLPALVRNDGDEAVALEVRFEATGLEVVDDSPRSVSLGPREEGTVAWPVRVPAEGPEEVVLRFTAAGEAASDATEERVPVLDHAVPRAFSASGRSERAVRIELPEPATLESPRARLVVSNGPLAAIAESLRYLAGYPYGCTEQTLSRFLPAVSAFSARERLGLPAGSIDPSDLDERVEAGLARLSGLRHDDGGWGWWSGDPGDLWMTAYVRWGLAALARNGYGLGPLGRDAYTGRVLVLLAEPDSIAVLLSPAGPATDPERRGRWEERRTLLAAHGVRAGAEGLPAVIFFLRVMAAERAIEPARLEPWLGAWSELEPSLRALLVSALADLGESAEARRRLDSLLAPGALEHARGWSWWQSDTMTLALLLEAALRASPGDPRADEIAARLLGLRSGGRWDSTRDTAFAVLALVDHLSARPWRPGPVRWKARLDGRPVGEGSLEPGDLAGCELDLGPGGRVLEIDPDQEIYYDVMVEWVSRAEDLPPEANVLAIERRYERVRYGELGERIVERLAAGDAVAPGERVRVLLVLSTEAPLRHVMVEDPRPSGFETVRHTSGPGGGATEIAFFDDRVALFLSELPAGRTTIWYDLVPSVEGTLHALPARAEAMYAPAVRASSTEYRFPVAAGSAGASGPSRVVIDAGYEERLAASLLDALAGADPERTASLLEVALDLVREGSLAPEKAEILLASLGPGRLADPAIARLAVEIQLSAHPLESRAAFEAFLALPVDPAARLDRLVVAGSDPWKLYWEVRDLLDTGERVGCLDRIAGAVSLDRLLEFLARETDRAVRIEFARKVHARHLEKGQIARLGEVLRLARETDDLEFRIALLAYLASATHWPEDCPAGVVGLVRDRHPDASLRERDPLEKLFRRASPGPGETFETARIRQIHYQILRSGEIPGAEWIAGRLDAEQDPGCRHLLVALAVAGRRASLRERIAGLAVEPEFLVPAALAVAELGPTPEDEPLLRRAMEAAGGGEKAKIARALRSRLSARDLLTLVRSLAGVDEAAPEWLLEPDVLAHLDLIQAEELVAVLDSTANRRLASYLARALGRRAAASVRSDSKYGLAARGLAGDRDAAPALLERLAAEEADDVRALLLDALGACAPDDLAVRYLADPESRAPDFLDAFLRWSEPVARLAAEAFLEGRWAPAASRYLERDPEAGKALVAAAYSPDRRFIERLRAIRFARPEAARRDPSPELARLALPDEPPSGSRQALLSSALRDLDPRRRLEAARTLYRSTGERATYEDEAGALRRFAP